MTEKRQQEETDLAKIQRYLSAPEQEDATVLPSENTTLFELGKYKAREQKTKRKRRTAPEQEDATGEVSM